jgi:thiol-disulfide isomerase/thioredoxin
MTSKLSFLSAVLVLTFCIRSQALPVAPADSSGLIKVAYPRLSGGALAEARLADLPPEVIMRSGQIKLTQKDLDAEIAKAPKEARPQLKRNLFFVLENKTAEMLLGYEVTEWAKRTKQAGGAEADLVKSYLSSVTGGISVSQEECQTFYDKNRQMLGGAAFDQAKDQIKDYLLNQKRQDATNAYIASTGSRYDIELNKLWTAKQYSAAMENPVDKARDSGKPTMVDFGADWCQPCRRMMPVVEQLKKDYFGRLNVVFVNVDKEQVLAARYDTSSIPVQIFYNKDGKEFFRHVGFFPRDQIDAKLAEMGVK